MAQSSIALLRGQAAGSPVAVEFGRRVRAARRSKGLTQGEIAFPLTKSYVSAIERGRTLPSFGALLLLADHLGLDAAELVRGVNKDPTVGYTGADASATTHQAQRTGRTADGTS